MANKNLFASASKGRVADTVNNAGGVAYSKDAKSTLAQIACTNCFNGTYYVSAENNLAIAKQAVESLKNDPTFLAKVAIYSRDKGYLKDMPAFIVAYLATIDSKLFRKVFPIVIDNGKMLRNVIQIARSGVFGKKVNVGSGAFRHAVRDWFKNHKPEFIFNASVGNDPSMKDVLKMCHPFPETKEKAALYAYLLGAEFDEKTGNYTVFKKNGDKLEPLYQHPFANLPSIVQQYESYKKNKEGNLPKVDFRMLDSLGLGQKEWTEIARNAGWQMTRMNLNTFARHNVFLDKEVTNLIASRLANKEEIQKSRAYPYQLLMAYKAAEGIPSVVRESLQDAMEHSIQNVPVIDGKVYVCVDVSGSMQSSVTGTREGSTSAVRCLDVAALFGAAILRKNPLAEVIPFSYHVEKCTLNPRDTVFTNADKLANLPSGGTNCGEAIAYLNRNKKEGDAIIFISDNESWLDGSRYYGTGMMGEFLSFKKRNKNAKLVCIDITPNRTSQSDGKRDDVLQIGGFSDTCFDVIVSFLKQNEANHWVNVIEEITLD